MIILFYFRIKREKNYEIYKMLEKDYDINKNREKELIFYEKINRYNNTREIIIDRNMTLDDRKFKNNFQVGQKI